MEEDSRFTGGGIFPVRIRKWRLDDERLQRFDDWQLSGKREFISLSSNPHSEAATKQPRCELEFLDVRGETDFQYVKLATDEIHMVNPNFMWGLREIESSELIRIGSYSQRVDPKVPKFEDVFCCSYANGDLGLHIFSSSSIPQLSATTTTTITAQQQQYGALEQPSSAQKRRTMSRTLLGCFDNTDGGFCSTTVINSSTWIHSFKLSCKKFNDCVAQQLGMQGQTVNWTITNIFALRPASLLIILSSRLACVLSLVHEGIRLDKVVVLSTRTASRLLESKDAYCCFDCQRNFLFALRSYSSLVDIWNLNTGTIIGNIDVASTLRKVQSGKGGQASPPKSPCFSSMSLSADSLKLSLVSTNNQVYIIDLDSAIIVPFSENERHYSNAAAQAFDVKAGGGSTDLSTSNAELAGEDDDDEIDSGDEEDSGDEDEGSDEEGNDIGFGTAPMPVVNASVPQRAFDFYTEHFLNSNIRRRLITDTESSPFHWYDEEFLAMRRSQRIYEMVLQQTQSNFLLDLPGNPAESTSRNNSSFVFRISDNDKGNQRTEQDAAAFGLVFLYGKELTIINPLSQDVLVTNCKVTPVHIVIEFRRGEPGKRYLEVFDLARQFEVDYKPLPSCSRVMYHWDGSIVYLLDSHGINLVTFQQSKETILNNLILYESIANAVDICEINGWDQRDLKIHSLEFGLRNRELDVIEGSLASLDDDQKILASFILTKFVLDATPGSSFLSSLLNLGFKYISRIIEDKVALLTRVDSVLRPKSFASNPMDAAESYSRFTFENGVDVPFSNASSKDMKLADYSKLISTMRKSDVAELYGTTEQLAFLNGALMVLRSCQLRNQQQRKEDYSSQYKDEDTQIDYDTDDGESDNRGLARQSSFKRTQYNVTLDDETTESDHGDDDDDSAFIDDATIFDLSYKDWQNKDDREIMKEALLRGTVSSAFSFIKNRREKTRNGERYSFAEFKREAFGLVYEFFSNNEFENGLTTIENLGEDVPVHLKELAFNSTNYALRNQLIFELKQRNSLDANESEEIDFISVLEKLYPEPSFWKAYKRRNKNKRRKSTRSQSLQSPMPANLGDINSKDTRGEIFACGDLNDIAQFVEPSKDEDLLRSSSSTDSLSGMDDDNLVYNKRAAKKNSHKGTSGYLYISLNWARSWSKDTKERILIEKRKDTEDRDVESVLRYCISHHDVPGIVAWVDSLPLTSALHPRTQAVVNTKAKKITYLPAGQQPSPKSSPHEDQQIRRIVDLVTKELQFCSPFLAEVLLTKLADRGIFIFAHGEDGDQSFFARLAKKLAQTCQLFPTFPGQHSSERCIGFVHGDNKKPQRIDTSSILPVGKAASMHQFFVNFCIERDLPNVMEAYINAYNLWRHIKTDTVDRKERKWVDMVMLSSNPEKIFDLSLANAKIVLKFSPKDNVTVNKILSGDRPLIAIATIMFAGIPIKEAMKASTSSELYIDAKRLREVLNPYPIYDRFLFKEAAKSSPESKHATNQFLLADGEKQRGDLVTNEGDTSLFEMLSETHRDISLDEILALDDDEEDNEDSENGVVATPSKADTLLHFSSPKLTRFAYVDALDVEYFLSRARPMEAYNLVLSEFNLDFNDQFEHDFDNNFFYDNSSRSSSRSRSKNNTDSKQQHILDNLLSVEAKNELGELVRSIALQNVLDEGVVSGCKMFLDMCGIESHTLHVDCQAARRVFQHHPVFSKSNDVKHIFELFMQLNRPSKPPGEDSFLFHNENLVLKYLEEATDYIITHGVSTKETQVVQGLDEESKFYVSPYLLIFLFCSVHNLPTYSKHLEELSRTNQWISLLYEAQTERIPVRELYKVVKQYFTDTALKEHLLLVLRQIELGTKKEQQLNLFEDEAPSETMELFDTLIKCEQMDPKQASELLIDRSVQVKQPLMCVLALCFDKEMDVRRCFLGWLIACKACLEENKEPGPQKDEKDASATAESDTSSEELDSTVLEYAARDWTYYLIRCFKIFDRANPVLQIVEFYHTFRQNRFKEAREFLIAFMEQTRQESDEVPNTPAKRTTFNIGSDSWVHSMADRLITQLAQSCLTSFERSHFLSLLNEVKFNDYYERMYQIDCIMREVGIYYLDPLREDPSRIVREMMKLQQYDRALSIADLFGKSSDTILREQASNMIQQLQDSSLWSFEQERNDLWSRTNEFFKTKKYPPIDAGIFLIERAHEFRESITPQELVTLLSYALKWFNSSGIDKHASYASSSPSLSGQVFTSVFTQYLEFLKNNVSLISMCNDDAIMKTLGDSASQYVSSIVSSIYQRTLITFPTASSPLAASNNSKKQLSFKPTLEPTTTSTYAATQDTANHKNISKYLDVVVDDLLKRRNLKDAEDLCTYFHHHSKDLDVIHYALSLAKGTIKPGQTPANIAALAHEIYPTLNFDAFKEAHTLLEKIGYICQGPHSRGARDYCKRIALMAKVGSVLQTPYQTVVDKDPFEVLRLLLMCGKEMFKLCFSFILLNSLDPQKTSHVCAEFLFSSFCSYYNRINTGGGKQRSSPSSSSSTATSQQDDDHAFQPSSPPSNDSNNSSNTVKTEAATWTKEEFIEFAQFSRDPVSLGSHLIKLLTESVPPSSAILSVTILSATTTTTTPTQQQQQQEAQGGAGASKKQQQEPVTLECQVELLIRAYWCYQMAFSSVGTELVMKMVHALVRDLIKNNRFKSLVRLLIGLQTYAQLSYLFDVLMEHEQFELILKNNTAKEEHGNLKMALSSYIKNKYPDDSERLMMVYLRFHMFKELGGMLLDQAKEGLKKLHERLKTQNQKNAPKYPTPVADDIVRVTQRLYSASDAFYKAECYATSNKCLMLAALTDLQRKNTDLCIVQISAEEARRYMRGNPNFFEALIVANAYDLNMLSEWIEPLFYNVLVKGNLEYFNDFRSTLPTPPSLFREMAKRFKQEPSPSRDVVAMMKLFVRATPDYRVQYEIARDLKFDDILAQTAAVLDISLNKSPSSSSYSSSSSQSGGSAVTSSPMKSPMKPQPQQQ